MRLGTSYTFKHVVIFAVSLFRENGTMEEMNRRVCYFYLLFVQKMKISLIVI